METRLITGNEAIALGALRAGVKVVTGYPGTPSTGALTSLLEPRFLGENGVLDRHVEWSVNEKVALEVAAGVAWAGQRALCTMKMSGVNVAYDTLISIAYSGVNGGLVIYVADDSGVSAGMAEQDSRGFAIMSDLPMLEPASVAEAYRLTQVAFELSERVGTPVFIRLVTALANSKAAVVVAQLPATEACPRRGESGGQLIKEREPILEWDITKYTKAGAAICMAQHRDLIARLERAGEIIGEMKLNQLQLSETKGGLGIIAVGVTAAYLEEGYEIAARFGFARERAAVLRAVTTSPFPTAEVRELLQRCDTILVLEELEPHFEKNVYVAAHQLGYTGRIIGKLDGAFSRVGEYNVSHVVRGIGAALGLTIPDARHLGGDGHLSQGDEAERLAAPRPITFCAGCPHRGTYMAINRALKKLKYKKGEVMVTGDIGCTILGMNPPLHTVWNEVSMGASTGLAQGYVHAGTRTPVISTIGDSTFFHGGIAGLINAVQYQVPLTMIILDNGWTSMTGMQANPGTAEAFQPPENRRLDIAKIVPALGVEHFFVIDPFDLEDSTATVQNALPLPGVKVILSQRECAIPMLRRGERAGEVRTVAENCTLCKQCITLTGCPAISIGEKSIVIDAALCTGCGLCAQVCKFGAIVRQTAPDG